MNIKEIAEFTGGAASGNLNAEISNVGKIETAGSNEITFIANPLYEKFFSATKAGAVLVSESFVMNPVRDDIAVIKVHDPYTAFVKLLELFNKSGEKLEYGISKNCAIGKNSKISEKVFIDDFVKIGDDCEIGEGCRLMSGCKIDSGVKIGKDCIIWQNAVIYKDCVLGNNVIIHSGAVIGSDGFGFAKQEDGKFKKILQTGIVVLEDDVEIGSNTTIDRATIGETRLCRGVKLDNQIQIAHNVFIDEDTVIAAQAGIAGTTHIGKRCMIGGQAGIVGHLTICDDVIIGASVGVTKSITKPGMYTGYRAKPFKDDLKQEASIKYIEQLREEIKQLKNK